jgi:ACS family hexuronate transporter-like MFS transporter
MTGILSCLGWLISAPIHPIFGRYVDRTGSFDLGIALVGLAPLVGLVAMLVLWPTQPDETHPASPVA